MNSSGSAITAELKLAITLRILAGASYLDMIHYHVHVDSVHSIVLEVVQVIHRCIDNIKVATNELECKVLAMEWNKLQMKRWGAYLMGGTLYAGDGLLVEITRPTLKELRGRPLIHFLIFKAFGVL